MSESKEIQSKEVETPHIQQEMKIHLWKIFMYLDLVLQVKYNLGQITLQLEILFLIHIS